MKLATLFILLISGTLALGGSALDRKPSAAGKLASDSVSPFGGGVPTPKPVPKATPSPTPAGELHAQVEVSQRLPDGLLCRIGDKTVKLIGHPKEKELVDGDETTIRALPIGTYQYKTTLGALATVRVYKVTEVTK